MDTNQIDPDTYQFPPVSVYLAKSDAAWLRLWAPDPRALGAEAMGLAALRGLLAEDQPKDGQPLGGEIQHARALIENANALARRIIDTEPTIRTFDLDGSEMFDTGARGRIAALVDRNAGPRLASLEARLAEMGNRITGHDTLIRVVETAQDIQRNRIAALEAKS